MLRPALPALLLLIALGAGTSPAAAGAGVLTAGAAAVELRLPAGVPLAGYGSPARRPFLPDLLGRHPHAFWFKPAVGVRDPIMARALVVESGAERLLWVAADLVAVDAGLVADVRDRMAARGFRYSAVILSASHTHSGPGAFVDSRLFGLVAADRFDPAVRAALLAGLAAAAERAERGRGPAAVGAGRSSAPGLTASRLDGPLDPEIAILKFVGAADGGPIALLWNYAIHGTTLGPRNLSLSADVMGDASRRLEQEIGAPALFVNGAVGDVSPREHGPAAAAELGARLARAAAAAWRRAETGNGGALALARARVELPAPFLSARNCLGRWVPGFLRAPLDGALPRSIELLAGALGGAGWVTIPGELETRLGEAVKAAGRRRFPVAFVAGLSNGYVGYLLTPEAYHRSGYIECASLYGERAGEEVAAAAAGLLGRLPSPPARRARPDAGPARTSSARPCCGGSHPW